MYTASMSGSASRSSYERWTWGMPSSSAAPFAFDSLREAIATISVRAPRCIAGMIFLSAMFAAPRTPHRTFSPAVKGLVCEAGRTLNALRNASQLPNQRSPLLHLLPVRRIVVPARQEPLRIVGQLRAHHVIGHALAARVSRHEPRPRQRADDEGPLRAEGADQRTILRRLAVVASVHETARRRGDGGAQRRRHLPAALEHQLAFARIEARRPDVLSRLVVQRPDEKELVTVREIDGSHMNAGGVRLAVDRHRIIPDHEWRVAGHSALGTPA